MYPSGPRYSASISAMSRSSSISKRGRRACSLGKVSVPGIDDQMTIFRHQFDLVIFSIGGGPFWRIPDIVLTPQHLFDFGVDRFQCLAVLHFEDSSPCFFCHAPQFFFAPLLCGSANRHSDRASYSHRVRIANGIEDRVRSLGELDGGSDRRRIFVGHAIGEQNEGLSSLLPCGYLVRRVAHRAVNERGRSEEHT